MPYLHIVMMAFNKPVTASLTSQVEACFQNVTRGCAGVERFELLENESKTSPNYTHALLSVFSDERALEAYKTSAAHDALMAELSPHIQGIIVLDTLLRQDHVI